MLNAVRAFGEPQGDQGTQEEMDRIGSGVDRDLHGFRRTACRFITFGWLFVTGHESGFIANDAT